MRAWERTCPASLPRATCCMCMTWWIMCRRKPRRQVSTRRHNCGRRGRGGPHPARAVRKRRALHRADHHPPHCAGDTVTLRFRVGGVYKNKKIAVYRGTDCIYSRKRSVLAPGEMETVRLKAELLRGPGDAVTVTLEEG